LQHSVLCAVLARSETAEQSRHALDKIRVLEEGLISLSLPWMKTKDAKGNIKDLGDMWKKKYGDPNDPEVKRKIARTVEAMKQKTKKKKRRK
jgi:hypothetical protein